jgi:hypothetical protein
VPAHLDLSRNGFGATGASHLAECLQHSDSLTSLNIASNNIGAVGAAHLAKLLRRTPLLTALDVSKNNLGTSAADALAGGLGSTPLLTHLGASDNNLGPAGARFLAEGLRHTPLLVALSVERSNLGPAGLADALTHLSGLTNLAIGPEGIEGLCATPLLRTLDITQVAGGTALRPNDTIRLASSLAQLSALTALHVYNNLLDYLPPRPAPHTPPRPRHH